MVLEAEVLGAADLESRVMDVTVTIQKFRRKQIQEMEMAAQAQKKAEAAQLWLIVRLV